MSGRIHRMLRKQSQAVAQHHTKILTPAINAALTNEELTRKRVDVLEENIQQAANVWNQRIGDLESVIDRVQPETYALLAFRHRSFFGRLAWVLWGR